MRSESPVLRHVFDAKAEDGELRVRDLPRWRGMLGRYRGKSLTVTVERFRAQRSLPQNAYLWGVVYPVISEWSGERDSDKIHAGLKSLLLWDHAHSIDLPGGGVLPCEVKTSELSLEEFGRYVDAVVLWAAEQGLHIPEPGEYEPGGKA